MQEQFLHRHAHFGIFRLELTFVGFDFFLELVPDRRALKVPNKKLHSTLLMISPSIADDGFSLVVAKN